jgi:ankyrin repeat protein
MRAASLGEEKGIAALLDAGADPNARSKVDVTPLMFAALTGQGAVMRMLCRRLLDGVGELRNRPLWIDLPNS